VKKHTLTEHLECVKKWYYAQEPFMLPDPSDRQIIFFTAYERWLNDRVLLTEEDKVAAS